jgi:pSer/pThr/pTyr-binding forkhead associated (FHA) protein
MRWMLRVGRREIAVPTRAVVIGRGRDADLQLEDESVSRRHARLLMQESQPVIEDLGSQNGTFVNGRAIVGAARLAMGDRITVGTRDLELMAAPLPSALGQERATEPMSRQRIDKESAADTLGALSPREREVFAMLAEGIAQRDIARHFGVSPKTIETHRTRIGQKLQIKTRAELVRRALAAGVLKPDSEA